MSTDYFTNELPLELISLFVPILSTASLNALALTCHRLHQILQPELEARITPELGKELLLWAAASKAHIVAKLLAPPHSIKPNEGYGAEDLTPLHAAAKAGNAEIVALLLDAGADIHALWDEYQPLHLAVQKNHLPTVRLLLDRGADINASYDFDGYSLHQACWQGHLDMVSLLLERGAKMELRGNHGTPLGFALHACRLDVMRLLLEKGAKAETSVRLNGNWLCGGPPPPHKSNLLYLALGLRHPRSEYSPEPPPEEGRKERIAMLLAYGASKDKTMKIIFDYLKPLAEAADKTEEEFLDLVRTRFKEAEAIIADVTTTRKLWAYRVKAGGRALLPSIGKSGREKVNSKRLPKGANLKYVAVSAIY
ncbi:ANK-REP-REGION domain-containing protein [Mycena venus]|uniref:ANK-REP-REGION domain-containing protein n=1 Tax=Mycena venus TaxID=2733690 RepID=A0A8H6WYB9_9AGAR|nr:ANK-REP-REGION domain-containing protein [Mycena venus]